MALNGEHDEDPYALMALARTLDFGVSERSDLLDRAIALADRSGSPLAQFEARLARASDAGFSGQPELLLAHFAWCQRAADKDPSLSSRSMLWCYKSVMEKLALFSRITQQQIDAIVADMRTRYLDQGISQRPLFTSQTFLLLSQGRIDEARRAWNEAMLHPRDSYADCRACEARLLVDLLAAEKRFDELLDAALPIVQGRLQCAEVPHTVLTTVMLAHYVKGNTAQAEQLAERSYRLIRSNPDFLDGVSLHVQFLAALQRWDKAARMAIRHAQWVTSATNDISRLRYAKALHCVLAGAVAHGITGPKWVKDTGAIVEKIFGSKDGLDAGDKLQHWTHALEEAGRRLAAALDARNGTDYYARAWLAAPFSADTLA